MTFSSVTRWRGCMWSSLFYLLHKHVFMTMPAAAPPSFGLLSSSLSGLQRALWKKCVKRKWGHMGGSECSCWSKSLWAQITNFRLKTCVCPLAETLDWASYHSLQMPVNRGNIMVPRIGPPPGSLTMSWCLVETGSSSRIDFLTVWQKKTGLFLVMSCVSWSPSSSCAMWRRHSSTRRRRLGPSPSSLKPWVSQPPWSITNGWVVHRTTVTSHRITSELRFRSCTVAPVWGGILLLTPSGFCQKLCYPYCPK